MVKLSKVEDNSVLRLKNKFNSRPNQGINVCIDFKFIKT
jgi:hypothetical protein